VRSVAARPVAVLLAGAAAALLCPAASADILMARDGRVFDGAKLTKEGDALVLHYINGDIRVPLAAVEDYVIDGAPLPDPASEEEREKRRQGLVPWRGKWVPVAVREKEQRSEAQARAKAIEEHRKHREWRNRYQFKTAHFEFESTQPPSQNEDFAELLETYFREFSKVWKVTVPPKWGRLKVCFFGSSADFHRTATNRPNVLAYYRFVEPRELDFFYERNAPEQSVECLFHEANHYLTHLLNERFCYPHWVNEAMAEYYGASQWDSVTKTMKVGGILQGRLAEVRKDMADQKFMNVKDLVSSTAGAYQHYYWGWSFVHFLMESPKHRTKFMKFFADLATARDIQRVPQSGLPGFIVIADGQEILKAFLSRMALKEQDLSALQSEWYKHIESLDATDVSGLEQGGLNAFREGYWRFRAPRLLKEAVEKGSRSPNVWAVYSWCLHLAGDEASRAEAQKVMAKATETMPLESSLWAIRGYVAYASGDKETGTRLVALANELSPDADHDDPETWLAIRAVRDSGE
jgi:hypothetical protein